MYKITDRYILGSNKISDDFIQDMLNNFEHNKKIILEANELEEWNNCLYIEELLELHSQYSNNNNIFEILFTDLSIRQISLEVNQKNIDRKKVANEIDSNFRVKKLEEFAFLKDNLLDNKYGYIFNIYKDVTSNNYAMVGSEFSPFKELDYIEVGYGRANNFFDAEIQSILEALERMAMYRSTNYTKKCVLSKMWKKELMTEYSIYMNAEIECVETNNIKTGKSEWLPKELFIFNGKNSYLQETSNGTAIGSSYYEALVYSLLEFIERDAFLIFWHKQVQLLQIDKTSLTEEQKRIINEFETNDRKVYLFDMTFDINIPVILSLVISNEELPATYVSAGAHINYYMAIDNALKEAIVAHNVYRRNKSLLDVQYKTKYDVKTLEDHYKYYSTKNSIKTYDFLFTNEKVYNVSSLINHKKTLRTDQECVEFILDKMKHINDIYCLEYDYEILKKLGLTVTKLIIPEMQTMYFGMQNKRINQPRIEEGLKKSKYSNKSTIQEGEYFDEPHPFP
ncbi:YcaO-like family protein [Lysinibacillus xylanilyticus]|uniref:YcaO-like family protein n=1 Tax=Lysinibacillus xylanilyticus TaxID=582475 RepID=UPI00381C448A